MKKGKYFIVLCCMFVCANIGKSLFAQVDTAFFEDKFLFQEEIILSTIELMAEEDEFEQDYNELLEDYMYYAEHKININQPDYDVLMSVFKLSDYQIYQLKKYLDSKGSIQSVYELVAIEGFTKETVASILPYIEIVSAEEERDKKISMKRVCKYGKHTLLLRSSYVVEPQAGYKNKSDSSLNVNPNLLYQGSKPYVLFKYKFDYASKIRFGLTAEKDAGEEFFKGSNKQGFDFYSFHFFMRDFKWLKSLAIGDFQVQFGQGVSMWTGFRPLSTGNAIDVFRYGKALSPYTSSNEVNYLRGIATELQFGKTQYTIWYSYRMKDAILSDTSLDSELYVTSLQETGFHRTIKEIERKNNYSQQLTGAFMQYTHRVFRVGGGVFYSHLSYPLNKELKPYNQYVFNSQNLFNASISNNVIIKKISVYGENAMSHNGGFALLNGLVFYADPLVTLSAVHRYYSRDYQGVQSAAFGESSSNANETGLYVGAEFIVNRYFILHSYIDYFHFMWLKYRVDAPSSGYKIYSQLTYTLNSKCVMFFRFRYQSKEVNEATEYYNQIIASNKQNYRFQLQLTPISSIQLKSCVEYVAFYPNQEVEKQHGVLVYQDIRWIYKRISLAGRYALFQTDNYDTRIYAYESDVLYASSIPAHYAAGSRFYIMLKIEITPRINMWLKVSQTFYANKNSVSSGSEEINGNTKTDIRLQMIAKI